MQEFIRLGTQFVGYHDYAKQAEGNILLLLLANRRLLPFPIMILISVDYFVLENLAEANKRADTLAR
jgi:hypothetical protein